MQIHGCRLPSQGCVPVKWTAPEVLFGDIAKLSSKSDVYVLFYAPIKSKLQHLPSPPPPGKARAVELLKIGSFQIPAPSGQNSVQIPYPIVEFVCQMPLLKNNRCPFLSSVIKLVHIPCMRRHKFKMKRYFGLLLRGTR